MRIVVKGGVWKNTEDEILKAAVMKYGKNNWARVASLLNRKSAKQCKARWYEWLDPSIRKIDWSREEEEKLLHLAKLMPNQWRTIAPIVGRTAGQCIEHYEDLLDRAQDGASGADGTTDDPRKLRPGEIDPAPENKPARPDPIDMDEDEKEMLSEARARLANTKGKKAKRKAREKQLEEARRLAMLQKRRELKAAGVESSLGGSKKRKLIDYVKEIPFQKVAPAGFFDTGEETQLGKHMKLDPRKAGQDMMELEGRADAEREERVKRQENSRVKRLFKENAPAAIMKIAQENDPIALRRRSALALPAPQVGDTELELIVKQGQRAGGGNGLMPPPTGRGVSSMLGNGSSARAMSMPMRTPVQEDVVLQEARNHRALRQAAPLDGEELPELFEGTGFAGAQPRASRLATPNTVLSATPMSSAYGATPASSVRGWGGPRQTPRRDDQSDGYSIADGSESVVSDAYSVYAREQKLALVASLKTLPEPEYTYEVAVPALPEDDRGTSRRKLDHRPDAAEVAARARQHRAEEEERLYRPSNPSH